MIMISAAQSPQALAEELHEWQRRTNNVPAAIVAHKDLPFEVTPEEAEQYNFTFSDGSEVTWTKLCGIPVIDLDDLWQEHAEQLGYDGSDEDEL